MLTRRQLLTVAGAGGLLMVAPVDLSGLVEAGDTEMQRSVVLRWNGAMLQAVREGKLGPPMVARALAIVHTSMYDAWAAYNPIAVGTRLGDGLRRPRAEHTLANKSEAISFAAYRAAIDLYPGAAATIFGPLMRRLGYNANDLSRDPGTPVGVGNIASAALLAFRHHDGSNQLGDEAGGVPGAAYSDYTGYRTANDPMDIDLPFDPKALKEPNQWQPLRFVDGTGTQVTQPLKGACSSWPVTASSWPG